jgi:hypothetical protein
MGKIVTLVEAVQSPMQPIAVHERKLAIFVLISQPNSPNPNIDSLFLLFDPHHMHAHAHVPLFDFPIPIITLPFGREKNMTIIIIL